MARFESAVGREIIGELWEAVRRATTWSLQLELDHGKISQATFDTLVNGERRYYVPQRGWAERSEEVHDAIFGKRGETTSGGAWNTALKTAKGRESLAANPGR